jgi:hypothetical protein
MMEARRDSKKGHCHGEKPRMRRRLVLSYISQR